VKQLLESLKRVYFASCYIAWFVNVGLLVFAAMRGINELQLLAIVNMMLLSFVLLRE
jgi:hypothetical protein